MRLERKIEARLLDYYANDPGKILLIDGARQTGKSFIIRDTARKHFRHYVEINLFEDSHGAQVFRDVDTVDKFHLALSLVAGKELGSGKEDTIVFLDEIQEYGKLLPLLKFINQDGRYRYIASGSALGVELSRTSSIPMGSITIERLFPLDFEEFLWAAGVAKDLIAYLRSLFKEGKEVDDAIHNVMMAHLRTYLLTGGLPEAVRLHFEGSSIDTVRKLHTEILAFYAADCAKYDSGHRLQIMRIYRMLPSFMEQRKKRIVYKKIDPKSARADRYADEFDYLSACGVALPALAVPNPVFPLLESATKNLLKLYLNDVGLLSAQFFADNVRPVLEDVPSVNLGSLYETFVAMELSAHSHSLFYYDNREKGEVDFLINDYDNLCILPIEVKSGRDWQIHSSLTRMVTEGASKGIVLCNSNKARHREGITYLPVYMAAFL